MINQTTKKLKQIIEGKTDVIIPTFKLITFADLKKHMFFFNFLSSAINVENFKTVSVEPVGTILKDHLPQLNNILKKLYHQTLIPTMSVVRINGADMVLSSIP